MLAAHSIRGEKDTYGGRRNREQADGAQRDWLLDLTLDWRKSFSRVQATGPR